MKKSWKIFLSIIGVIVIIWFCLEPIVLHYLNKELDSIEGYNGHVQDVDIYLLSGGIQVDSLILEVKQDGFTRPFIDLPSSYASLEWSSLFKGHIVGEILLTNPILNYEIEPSSKTDNVNEELNWVEIVKDIGMVTLNTVEIENGQFNYLDRSNENEVLLYIDSLNATGKNLATIENESKELPSFLEFTGHSIGDGQMHLKADASLLKQVPDFDMSFEYTSVDLTAFNTAFNEYARIDLEAGSLEFFTEVALKDSALSGYFKPILRNTKVIDWDAKEKNPIRAIWEGFVGLIAKPIENRSEDQIASKIPLNGTIADVDGGVWTSVYFLFKNAYIEPLSRTVEETISFDDITTDQ